MFNLNIIIYAILRLSLILSDLIIVVAKSIQYVITRRSINVQCFYDNNDINY